MRSEGREGTRFTARSADARARAILVGLVLLILALIGIKAAGGAPVLPSSGEFPAGR
jgi:hypothetical protein